MIHATDPLYIPGFRQFAVWLLTIIVVAFGFRHAKELMALMLDKLYEVFIQDNPVA